MICIFCQIAFSVCVSMDDSNKKILEINHDVMMLEQSLESGLFQKISIEHDYFLESAPAQINFYLDKERLRAVYIRIAHETWENKFCYYFDKDENIIKFLKIILYRGDKNPRKSIFYNKDGSIIWKNIEKCPVDPKVLKDKIKLLHEKLTGIEKHFVYF